MSDNMMITLTISDILIALYALAGFAMLVASIVTGRLRLLSWLAASALHAAMIIVSAAWYFG